MKAERRAGAINMPRKRPALNGSRPTAGKTPENAGKVALSDRPRIHLDAAELTWSCNFYRSVRRKLSWVCFVIECGSFRMRDEGGFVKC